MHEQALASAVVIKQHIPPSLADQMDDLEIDLFYFNGCCKCVIRERSFFYKFLGHIFI
jgi:hypothetical protein